MYKNPPFLVEMTEHGDMIMVVTSVVCLTLIVLTTILVKTVLTLIATMRVGEYVGVGVQFEHRVTIIVSRRQNEWGITVGTNGEYAFLADEADREE